MNYVGTRPTRLTQAAERGALIARTAMSNSSITTPSDGAFRSTPAKLGRSRCAPYIRAAELGAKGDTIKVAMIAADEQDASANARPTSGCALQSGLRYLALQPDAE